MEFNYQFLVIASDQTKLQGLCSLIREDFPNAQIMEADNGQDAIDFCRANVFDLIVADSMLEPLDIEATRAGIRELDNDNLSSGILIIGALPRPLVDLSHVMCIDSALEEIDREGYLEKAKMLITLKGA